MPALLLQLQGSAGNAAVCSLLATRPMLQRDRAYQEPTPITGQSSPAKDFVDRWRPSTFETWDDDGMARELAQRLDGSGAQFTFVRAVIDELPASIEDNVAADLVSMISYHHPPRSSRLPGFAADPEGRAMLDVLYEAMITGNVSDFEREQSEKILRVLAADKPQEEALADLDHLMVFPYQNVSVLSTDRAAFKAELLPDGKVHVNYRSEDPTYSPKFKKDLDTLPPWPKLRDGAGIELQPDQIVAVRSYDDGDDADPLPMPAIGLIDFSNQLERKTVSTAATAFLLGLSLGAGGLGGATIEAAQAELAAAEEVTTAMRAAFEAKRALMWLDRVAFVVQAGSLVIDGKRGWIRKTFPSAGPALLSALDEANVIAGYYGWGRLGLDTIKSLRSKLQGALGAWSSQKELASLQGPEKLMADKVQLEAETFESELGYAEDEAAAKEKPPGGPSPEATEVRATARRGKARVEVHDGRVEICPIQRCPTIDDVLAPDMNKPKVADDVRAADDAAKAGNTAEAEAKAKQAIHDTRTGSGKADPATAPAGTQAQGSLLQLARQHGVADVIDEEIEVFAVGTTDKAADGLAADGFTGTGGNFGGRVFAAADLDTARVFARRKVSNVKGAAPAVVGVALPRSTVVQLRKQGLLKLEPIADPPPELAKGARQWVFEPAAVPHLSVEKGDAFYFRIE